VIRIDRGNSVKEKIYKKYIIIVGINDKIGWLSRG
jgi:hypothetical protein